MDVCERVKLLRTEMHMSLEEFGEQLGVNLSVIYNIEHNRLKNLGQKTSLFKLMCKEFGVREDWLLRGEGDMWEPEGSFSLEEFLKERQVDGVEARIVRAYFELSPETRLGLIEHFKDFFTEAEYEPPQDPVSEAEAAYIKSRLENAKGKGRSASSITDGGGEDRKDA